jgi:hypothetical protein
MSIAKVTSSACSVEGEWEPVTIPAPYATSNCDVMREFLESHAKRHTRNFVGL